jgi:hypothetical protein
VQADPTEESGLDLVEETNGFGFDLEIVECHDYDLLETVSLRQKEMRSCVNVVVARCTEQRKGCKSRSHNNKACIERPPIPRSD